MKVGGTNHSQMGGLLSFSERVSHGFSTSESGCLVATHWVLLAAFKEQQWCYHGMSWDCNEEYFIVLLHILAATVVNMARKFPKKVEVFFRWETH
jgi:hypothetical protein